MNLKVIAGSFVFSSIIAPILSFSKYEDAILSIGLLFLSAILGYFLYARLELYSEFTSDEKNDVRGVDGVIVSDDSAETPFQGDKCTICSWSIYEWKHYMRREGWKTAATGIIFGDEIVLEDDSGQKYKLDFEDVQTSRELNFLSISRLRQPFTSTSGTRVDGISAEFENSLFNSMEIDADENPTQRIVNFLDKLRTSVAPTDKESMFGKTSGDRKYVESFVRSGDELFVRGRITQSEEYGIKRIVPAKETVSILSDKQMDEYTKDLETQVSAVVGAICSLSLWSVVFGLGII